MKMSDRAYTLLDIKSVSEDSRVIEGIASTPRPDRQGDVVEPLGATYRTPMPLLLDHDSRQAVGHVEIAKASKDGITFKARIVKIDEPGELKDLTDKAWLLVKHRLRAAVSIGFRALEGGVEIMKDGGYRFTSWEWLELSLVSIPAQSDAVVFEAKSLDAAFTHIKSIDESLRAAPGHEQVVESTPGASGKRDRAFRPVSLKSLPERSPAMNIAEQIKAAEDKRRTRLARQSELMAKSAERGETLNAEEETEYDGISTEVDTLNKHLDRLSKLEQAEAKAATPVNSRLPASDNGGDRSEQHHRVIIKSEKLAPGILFTRLTRAKLASVISMKDGNYLPAVEIARRDYGHDSQVVSILQKGTVAAGTTVSGSWAVDLISEEGAAVAEFLEYLRPQTIIGKFAALGKPLMRIPFYAPIVTQTGAGSAYWTGEAKPKGLTSLDFDRTTLTPLKIANIAVASKESLQFSNPSLETILRDQLAKAIIQGVDLAFVDPSNNGSVGVKPASVTYDTVAMTSTGDDEDDVDLDIRALFQRFINAENQASMSVWGMSPTNAVALSMMKNALGQKAYPDVTINGGFLAGLPVIVSSAFGTNVVLFAADQILIGGDDNVTVDMSDQASLEMLDTGFTQDQPTGAVLVSLWQNNLVALRAEMQINWKKGRPTAAQYIESADWGGAVPPS